MDFTMDSLTVKVLARRSREGERQTDTQTPEGGAGPEACCSEPGKRWPGCLSGRKQGGGAELPAQRDRNKQVMGPGGHGKGWDQDTGKAALGRRERHSNYSGEKAAAE